MADDPDDVRLPKPPSPLTPPEPQVLPPMSPSFAPEPRTPRPSLEPGDVKMAFEVPPPDFRSRLASPPPRIPLGGIAGGARPSPPRAGYGFSPFALAAIISVAVGIVGFILLRSPSSTATRETAGFRVIELPPGQHLISAEIGDAGQVFYRYAPLLPGEQPRTSTLDGRTSDWRFLERIHFIERAAE